MTITQYTRHGMRLMRMMRPSLPATPVVAQTETTLLTQIMLPAAPPMFCRARTTRRELDERRRLELKRREEHV